MNTVSLIGNLATDVEVKKLDDERSVASFLLAVDRPTSDRTADFIRVSTWNKQAELCEQFLVKGKRVGVEGRLRSRSWDDDDGNRRTAVEVVASHVQFLSPREDTPAGAGADADIPFDAAAA